MGDCVITCYPTNRRIQLCSDNKRSGIGHLTSFEADFLLPVIAASLFLSPSWSGMLHYLVIPYRIPDPVALPSGAAEPE
jgi:hypothetical protein